MKIYKFLKKNSGGTVSEVVDMIGLTQPTVSYHLKEMKEAGLLKSSKTGKEVHYFVNEGCPSEVRGCFLALAEF